MLASRPLCAREASIRWRIALPLRRRLASEQCAATLRGPARVQNAHAAQDAAMGVRFASHSGVNRTNLRLARDECSICVVVKTTDADAPLVTPAPCDRGTRTRGRQQKRPPTKPDGGRYEGGRGRKEFEPQGRSQSTRLLWIGRKCRYTCRSARRRCSCAISK
jgi:hypothetical protein